MVEKAKGSVPVGLEFEFKWKVEGDKATLEGLDGKDVEHVKERLEGEYPRRRDTARRRSGSWPVPHVPIRTPSSLVSTVVSRAWMI